MKWSGPAQKFVAGNMKSDSNKALIIPEKLKCVDVLR